MSECVTSLWVYDPGQSELAEIKTNGLIHIHKETRTSALWAGLAALAIRTATLLALWADPSALATRTLAFWEDPAALATRTVALLALWADPAAAPATQRQSGQTPKHSRYAQWHSGHSRQTPQH